MSCCSWRGPEAGWLRASVAQGVVSRAGSGVFRSWMEVAAGTSCSWEEAEVSKAGSWVEVADRNRSGTS